MRVVDVMTRNVYTVREWEELGLSSDLMRFRRFRHLPVIDSHDRVVGMVARMDLVEAAARPGNPRLVPVYDVMHRPPVTIPPDASVEEAAAAVAAYLPHRSAPETLAGLRKNLRRQGDRWIWRWDPRLLEGFSAHWHLPASPERILAAGRGVAAPVLLVRGALSDIVSVETAREFCAEVRGAEWVDVGDAAHMVVGDRNDRFLAAIVPFLERLAD